MIINAVELMNRTGLSKATLDIWITEEWLIPATSGAETIFSECDVARARLISDLIDELGVNSEGVGVILHLLDQMHGLRFAVAQLVTTDRSDILSQPQ